MQSVCAVYKGKLNKISRILMRFKNFVQMEIIDYQIHECERSYDYLRLDLNQDP